VIRTIAMVIVSFFLLSAAASAQTTQQPLSGRDAEIRGAVLAYIQQRTANLGCEIGIKRFSISGAPSFPTGPLDYEVIAPQQWEGWGNAGISIIVRQGNRVVRNLTARVEVEALAEMVVTVRQIDYGSVITAGDLALRKQDVASVRGRYLGRIEDVVGKKARITFKANAPLRSDQLEKMPLIKPGQLVTIVAENERMRITVTGKAKSAGAEGDTITVQNLNSLKELPARVLDAGTVQIVF
jgi:flagellar basal body P-ring formation protein FlgA